MTDLTFCYIHMTREDLEVLDTIGTSDYIPGELSDTEVEVPTHMKPPNPDDSDVLPSEVHPSYPFGNPNSIKHPASRPRRPWDPSSRALFEDMGYAGGGVNGNLRWKDLALDVLLPVDEEKELAERAAHARKMASGITSHPPHPPVIVPPGAVPVPVVAAPAAAAPTAPLGQTLGTPVQQAQQNGDGTTNGAEEEEESGSEDSDEEEEEEEE